VNPDGAPTEEIASLIRVTGSVSSSWNGGSDAGTASPMA